MANDNAAIYAGIATLQGMMQELLEAVRENEVQRVRDTATRAVSIMAKNLNPGDWVEWAYGMGQQEILGWGRNGDMVILSTRSGMLWSLDADQRVRVYR